MQTVHPAGASAEDESCRTGVRHHARRKNEPESLGRGINGAEKATAAESRAPIFFIDPYLAHAGKIDHQAAFATAKSGKTVATATDCGENPSGARRPDNSLHIRDTGATRNQTGGAGNHAVPDATRFGKFGVPGTQQLTVKPTV